MVSPYIDKGLEYIHLKHEISSSRFVKCSNFKASVNLVDHNIERDQNHVAVNYPVKLPGARVGAVAPVACVVTFSRLFI